MDVERVRRAMELFQEIWPHSGAARAMLLKQWCGQDAALRAQVQRLLDADRGPDRLATAAATGAFLAGQFGRQTGKPAMQRGDALPVLSGDYRIIRLIGEGGMGVVYEAEQARPRRRVALKALRCGLATPQALRRFEHEAQLLGRLHHPGIAQIYEAGAPDDEHPDRAFFVMEYVDGLPLDQYARQRRLSVGERVHLLLKVCDAVQHAHQRGVIHRDLKPANILVLDGAVGTWERGKVGTEERGATLSRIPTFPPSHAPQPKILDFGVARLVEAESVTTTMHTAQGILIGTLAYMSPEQIAGDSADVDTRADIYALGVLLYELLAGRQPHDLRNCSIPEAVRRISSQDPPRLGTIARDLAGDLETIVARAMERDRQQRYASAAEFAADLTRYLRHEPILARPATMLYRARKFALRHRAFVLGLSAVFVALIGGVVATSLQALRAERALARASDSEKLARVEAQRATTAARESESASRFLQELLAQADPAVSRGRELTVLDAMRGASARIEKELAGQPLIEAAVRDTIGKTLCNLAQYDEAESHLRSALQLRRENLGPQHADVATSLNRLTTLLVLRERFDEALPLVTEALESRRRLPGNRELQVVESLNLLSELHRRKSDLREAEACCREALAILERRPGPGAELHVAALNNLGKVLIGMYRYADAEQPLGAALDLARQRYGEGHPSSVTAGANLGWLYLEMSRPADAQRVLSATLEESQDLYGESHPTTARLEHNLAAALHALGDDRAAEPLVRRELAFNRRSLPAGHTTIGEALALLAEVRLADGSPAALEEARSSIDEALEIWRKAYGAGGWMVAYGQSIRGGVLAVCGQTSEAETLLLDAFEAVRLARGVRSRHTQTAAARLVALYEALDCPDDAARFRPPLAPLSHVPH